MMLAARGAFLAARRKTKWTNPYVTDGLVAMWDGEWNAGGGVHDAAATTWKDLSGNGRDLVITGSVVSVFSDNAFVQEENQPYFHIADAGLSGQAAITMEMCYQAPIDFKAASNDAEGYLVDGICVVAMQRNTVTLGKIYGCSNWKEGVYNLVATGQKAIQIANLVQYNGVSVYFDSSSPTGVFNGNITRTGSRFWSYNKKLTYISVGKNIKANIHDVRIYNRALTADEIAANYAVDKARFNLP